MSIIFDNVSKTFDLPVLEGVTLNFEDGKITALLGASGRGKTTVLRLIAGLEKPDKGKVLAGAKVGYLFQEHRLLPHANSFTNVHLAAQSDSDAENALELCCAKSLAKKLPSEMSGGERQRIALARLIAFGGDIWLLDEPFSALDADTKEKIIGNIMPLMRKRTVIMVTHSEEEAAIADNIIKL